MTIRLVISGFVVSILLLYMIRIVLEYQGKIFDIARGVDEKTLSLQYLETLNSIGASPSTKFIFPMEFSGLMGTFLEGARRSFKKE